MIILHQNVLSIALPYSLSIEWSYYGVYMLTEAYNFCDRSKLFEGSNLPDNCILGSCYLDLKHTLKVYQMKVL